MLHVIYKMRIHLAGHDNNFFHLNKPNIVQFSAVISDAKHGIRIPIHKLWAFIVASIKS